MNRTERLNKENAELKAKLKKLEKQVHQSELKEEDSVSKHHFTWKAFTGLVCLIIATALLIAGSLLIWTGNTIVDNDKYISTVGPLIEKPEIQTAVASYTTKEIFNNLDVETHVREALPPKAEFLTPQLTAQLRTQTEKSITKVLQNESVQQRWTSSLAASHSALINFSKQYEGNGELRISDIYTIVSPKLAETQLSFLADKQLPPKVGTIKVATAGWLPAMHKLSNHMSLYEAIVTGLFLALSAMSIWLAANKRRAVIRMARFYFAAMLVMLVAIRAAGMEMAAQVSSEYSSAVRVAYDTITQSLVMQTRMLLGLSLLVGLIVWLSGESRSASSAKKRFDSMVSGKLHESIFGPNESTLTLWVAKFKHTIQWSYVTLLAIIMLAVRLTPSLVAIYALMMLVGVVLVEIVAAKKK